MAPLQVFALLPSFARGTFFALAPFLGGLAGCGDSHPRLPLLQVMYQVDFEDQTMRAALGRGDLGAARAAGTRLRGWLDDDQAFAGWLERSGKNADPARFLESRRSFKAELDLLLGTIDGGDAQGASRVYGRMRMSCEICHRDFRPGP